MLRVGGFIGQAVAVLLMADVLLWKVGADVIWPIRMLTGNLDMAESTGPEMRPAFPLELYFTPARIAIHLASTLATGALLFMILLQLYRIAGNLAHARFHAADTVQRIRRLGFLVLLL